MIGAETFERKFKVKSRKNRLELFSLINIISESLGTFLHWKVEEKRDEKNGSDSEDLPRVKSILF